MNSYECSLRSDLTLLQEAQRRMQMARDASEDASGRSQCVMSKVETATQICRNGGRPELDYAERARERRLARQLAAKEHMHLDRHGTQTADAAGGRPGIGRDTSSAPRSPQTRKER